VLSPTAIAALRAHRTRQWQDNGLVFCTHTDGHIAGSNLRMAHLRLLKRVELPYIRFHDLRHTAATLLLLQRVPVKVVSEMLGHANVSITMNLYMHVLPTMRQVAAGRWRRCCSASCSQIAVKWTKLRVWAWDKCT
jgi:integrase